MSVGRARLALPVTAEQARAGQKMGRPNPAQEWFLGRRNFYQFLVAGYGLGKTTIGAFKADALMALNQGSHGIVMAPTYRHAETAQEAMRRILREAELREHVTLIKRDIQSRGEQAIELVNGAKAEYFSAVKLSSVKSKTVSWVWWEELEWANDPTGAFQTTLDRIREISVPGLRRIALQLVMVTSTAQSLAGILREKIDEAERERARAEREPGYKPETAALVAPSTYADGFGLKRETLYRWARGMEVSAFKRGVLCDLTPPPEVIYGEQVSETDYRLGGHLIDWVYQPGLPTYFGADPGVNWPYWLTAQYSAALDAVIIVDEWGPDGTALSKQVMPSMAAKAREYGLVGANGRPLRGREVVVFGDPTPIAGAALLRSEQDAWLAIDMQAECEQLGWHYRKPDHPRERANHLQIPFVRRLLRPPAGQRPRVLFSRALADHHERVNRHKQTTRGVWHGLREGHRFKVVNGVVQEVIRPTRYIHAVDGLKYLLLKVFNREFWTWFAEEDGLLGSSRGLG